MRKLSAVIVLGLALACSASVVRAEPPHTHEIIYTRPSGFWTSNRPAVGGAYRWRLLGIGGGIALLTGALMLRAIRKASAERTSRQLGELQPRATPQPAPITESPASTGSSGSATSAAAPPADSPRP